MAWPFPLRSLVRDRRGVAALELAIGMVPLVAMLLGGITYGGVLAAMLSLNHAASAGARAAIAGATLCERQAMAETAARNALLFGALSENAVITATVTESQVRVDITLGYDAAAITPVMLPVPETLSASMIADTDGPEFPAGPC